MSMRTAGPDYRETREWVQSGGLLRDWPMLNVNCGRCNLAAGRCLTESEAIVEKAEAEGRDLTDVERESIEVYAQGYKLLRQADAVMYPNPFEMQMPHNPRTGLPANSGASTFRYDEDAQKQHARPTTICPRCSTAAAEQQLRHECIDAGYGVLPTGVFVTQPSNQDGIE